MTLEISSILSLLGTLLTLVFGAGGLAFRTLNKRIDEIRSDIESRWEESKKDRDGLRKDFAERFGESRQDRERLHLDVVRLAEAISDLRASVAALPTRAEMNSRTGG